MQREFTSVDVHILAALLEQVGQMMGAGVAGVRVLYDGETEVQLNLATFQRLFREWTVEPRYSIDYPAALATQIGKTRFFALLSYTEAKQFSVQVPEIA